MIKRDVEEGQRVIKRGERGRIEKAITKDEKD